MVRSAEPVAHSASENFLTVLTAGADGSCRGSRHDVVSETIEAVGSVESADRRCSVVALLE